MCGIFGIVKPAGATIDLIAAKQSLSKLRHRGPDDEGYLLVNSTEGTVHACSGSDTATGLDLPRIENHTRKPYNIILGHRRLSIIDLSCLGHQPMGYADGRYWIVYNGEIYNYLELREILVRAGHNFRSTSDTEVILAAYREWRHGMLRRFVGMFSLAILDMAERKLFIARDFFGIKPFYYTLAGNQFAFASEIKPLLGLPEVGRQGNPGRLYDYFGFGLTDFGDETLFADIRQLPAANYAYVNLDCIFDIKPIRYWNIDLSKRQEISFSDAVDRIRQLFAESVQLHMRSDVPVGSCLSGGLDSSAIVMHMKGIQSPKQQLHTFSFIVEEPDISEEKYVDIVANAMDAVCHKTSPDAQNMLSELEQLIYCQEEPFMSSSVYAQFRVFKLAHESGVKVMLDGQGADEIFAGYYSMLGAKLTSLLTQGELLAAWRFIKAVPQNMNAYRLRMLLLSIFRMIPPGIGERLLSHVGTPSFPKWVDQGWFRTQGVLPHYRSLGRGKDALREETLASLETLSLPQLLRYEDRNSMHFSIESRVPFCNPEIARFAFSLPDGYLISDNGSTKSVLRESLRGIVPDPILRRAKIGFATPQKEWLKLQADWAQKTFNSCEIDALPFMKQYALSEIISAMKSSDTTGSAVIWRCLNIFYWTRIFKVTWC